MRDHHGKTTRWWRVLTVLTVLTALGAALAWQLDDALGLTVHPADIPAEHTEPAPRTELAPAPPLTGITAPDDPRTRLAARALADAYTHRGLPRPTLGPTPAPRLTTRTDPTLPGGPETYRLDRTPTGLTLTAATPAATATGLHALADRIRSGAPVTTDGNPVTPRLGLRLIDLGGVGLPVDPTAYTRDDYTLNTDVVGDAILPDAPYVDPDAVADLTTQFDRHLHHALAQGYNAVVIPGFLEYLTFHDLGVHPPGDPHTARATAMVAAFGPVWRRAHDLGMRVFLSTDMLALSPPLRTHLDTHAGGLDTEDDRLWQVYRAGLTELFTTLPYLDGLMVRIGEGGNAYRLPGWDFTSEIAVTTPTAVQAMLRTFLDVAAHHDKDIIFRSWTVGIGAVGDLHTSTDAYHQVLGDLHHDNLIVSTKYSLGDFYSHLPLNDTLLTGDHRRIIEFQSRREFEGLGALPNDLGPLHHTALNHFLTANPHIEGIWTWSQNGGPLLAGPRTLHLRTGFWQLADLNTYLTARLAHDPDTHPATATADWVRATFSHDPDTVAAICAALALSRDTITTGLYIGPYATTTVRALGLEPPPMMWIFEWDIVTGDTATLHTIYAVSRDHIDHAVTEGTHALTTATHMHRLVAGTDPTAWHDPHLRRQLLDTLDYQTNLLRTLAAYRTAVLRHAQWLDTGSPTAHQAFRDAAADYTTARDDHQRRYTGNLDLPAYNFTAADLGLTHAHRDAPLAWAARALLAAILLTLAAGAHPRAPLALRALWTGATRPWRLRTPTRTPTRTDRVLIWALPAIALITSRAIWTSLTAPAHLVPALGAWLLFAITLRLLAPRTNPFPLIAAIGGLALLRTVLLLTLLSWRGPGHYWFTFWTEPLTRSLYITAAFAAFLAVPITAYTLLRPTFGRAGATGRVLIATGTPLLTLSALTTAIGLETALTWWNDQLALLPWGLSRILGLTTYLEIPTTLPLIATATGAIAITTGTALTRYWSIRVRFAHQP